MNCVRWSMGDVSLHGIGTSLVPCQSLGCHPCRWTKLLPMCPDRTATLQQPGVAAQQPQHAVVAGKDVRAEPPDATRVGGGEELAEEHATEALALPPVLHDE